MINAAITGGLSLLGGLFGRDDAKEQQLKEDRHYALIHEHNAQQLRDTDAERARLGEELNNTPLITDTLSSRDQIYGSTSSSRNYVDIEGMMKAAEASGFNPVTFLRNGGMQAYMRTDTDTRGFDSVTDKNRTVTTGHNAAIAAQMRTRTAYQRADPGASQVQVPSFGSVLAGAAGAAYGSYADSAARREDQRFQRELLNTQLAAIQRSPQQSRSFYVPATTTSGSYTTPPTRRTGAVPVPLGRPTPFESEPATVTNPWYSAPVEGTNADAEMGETRYGEVLGEVLGVRNAANDFWLNTTGLTAEQRNALFREYAGNLTDWMTAPLISR